MQFKKGLIKKDLEKLKQKEWYHQRFDGCPNLIYLIGQMELEPESRKEVGGEFINHLIIFNNDRVDWYIDLADINRVSNIFFKKSYRQSLGIGKRIMKKWDNNKVAFHKKCLELDKINLTKLTNNELKNLYEDFFRTYFGWTSMSSVIDGFALGSDQFIETELKKFLSSQKIATGQGIFFSTLTAPTNQSFINEAEISLLKVALKIYQNQKLRKIFIANNVNSIYKKINHFPVEYQALRKHQHNFFWGKNNYVDSNILSISFFIKEIKQLLKNNIDVSAQIKRIETVPIKNKIDKQKLIKKLKLPKFLLNLIEISETFTYWQDERKKYTFLATYYGSTFLAEIGRRFDYPLVEMKYLFFSEIITLFTGQGHYVSRQEAQQRRKFSFHYDHRQAYEIITGAAAREVSKAIFKVGVKKSINDFRGLSASSGKVRGIVKIVTSAHEINKVNRGDILVAVMTRPDYIVGMKKAAAIITNEGGVTCHAAIVARELGIPCVIGTKIATEVLSDGDLVDVNGNHGVVTIIKRK